MKRLLLILALATAPAGLSAQVARSGAVAIPPIQFKTRVLRNGLTVLSVQEPSTANVAVQMWYKVGERGDPPGHAGMAHLFEHVLSQTTRNMPKGFWNSTIIAMGGSRGASTGPDWTQYRDVAPAHQLELLLWSHAERMGRAVITQESIDVEAASIAVELNGSLATPYGPLQWSHIPRHSVDPYRGLTIENDLADLRNFTAEDMQAYQEAYYRPDNAVLVVVGNFDPVQLDACLDKYLAVIERPERPIPPQPVIQPQPDSPRQVAEYGRNVPAPAVAFTYGLPAAGHADLPALAVLSGVLGSGGASRLHDALVKKGLASEIESLVLPRREAGLFTATAFSATGKQVEEIESALAAEIAKLREAPISEEELRDAKNAWLSFYLSQRESPVGRAQALALAAVVAGDPNSVNQDIQSLERVTAADVQRVAQLYLSDEKRTSIRYLDESARPGGQVPPPPLVSANVDLDLPPPSRPPHTLAPEGERQAPPVAQPPRPARLPRVAEHRLPNGLRLVYSQISQLPLQSMTVRILGGSSLDAADKQGVAALLAATVTEGAGSMTAAEIDRRIEVLGARLTAASGPDATIVTLTAPTAAFAEAAAIVADIVRRPALQADQLEQRKASALNSAARRMRTPIDLLDAVAARMIYGDALYGRNFAVPEHLNRIGISDLKQAHELAWRSDNIVVSLAGSMSPAEGRALVQRLFGSWARPARPLPRAIAANRAGPMLPPRVVVIDMPDARQAAVGVAVRTSPRNSRTYHAEALINNVLGGLRGRLFTELREKARISYSPASDVLARRDAGTLIAFAETPNENAVQAAGLVASEVNKIGQGSFTAADVSGRAGNVAQTWIRNFESTADAASTIGSLAAAGLPVTEPQAYLARLSALNAAAVNAVSTATFGTSPKNIVIIGDARRFMDALRREYPQAEIIPIQQLDVSTARLKKQD